MLCQCPARAQPVRPGQCCPCRVAPKSFCYLSGTKNKVQLSPPAEKTATCQVLTSPSNLCTLFIYSELTVAPFYILYKFSLMWPMKEIIVSLLLSASRLILIINRRLITKYKKKNHTIPTKCCVFFTSLATNSFWEEWLLRFYTASSFFCYLVPWISSLKLNSVCVQT